MNAPSLGNARVLRGALPGPASRLSGGQRGQITWVTLLLLCGLAFATVLGWTWLPVYFDHYAVKQVVRDYMNQAVKDHDDEKLVRGMIARIAAVRYVEATDEAGGSERVPAVRLEQQDVTWERDQSVQPAMLHVAFSYVREVTYPIAGSKATKEFTVDLSSDLATPDWGPSR